MTIDTLIEKVIALRPEMEPIVAPLSTVTDQDSAVRLLKRYLNESETLAMEYTLSKSELYKRYFPKFQSLKDEFLKGPMDSITAELELRDQGELEQIDQYLRT